MEGGDLNWFSFFDVSTAVVFIDVVVGQSDEGIVDGKIWIIKVVDFFCLLTCCLWFCFSFGNWKGA